MPESIKYNNHPIWIVILSNTLSLFIYALGSMIMSRLGWTVSLFYLLYILFIELRLIKVHCVDCYYYGKICGFGKGKLSSWFFKKGNIFRFCNHELTWKDIVPDLLINLIPFVTSIVLIIISFEIKILIASLLLIILSTMGNGFVRKNLACKYCKQKEYGCPADKLFNKEK